jgi:hypothetical protein
MKVFTRENALAYCAKSKITAQKSFVRITSIVEQKSGFPYQRTLAYTINIFTEKNVSLSAIS